MERSHPTEHEFRQMMEFHLSLQEAQSVTDHLRACPSCNNRYRQMAEGRPGAPKVPDLQTAVVPGSDP